MKKLFIICTLIFTFNLNAKEIALTFDDSPRFARGYLTGPQRADIFIKNLQKFPKLKVAFFSNSKHLDIEGRTRLMSYANAGHFIANHTHSHPHFNTTPLADYKNNFIQGHEELKNFPNFKRWFRFPYLKEGNILEKRDGMRKALKEHSYLNAAISVDNSDYYMELIFQREIKKNPGLNLEKVKNYFIKHNVEAAEYYEELALKYLKRSPRHVLLLHETDLSAMFVADLIQALENKGWKIINPDVAYLDELYQYQTEFIFPNSNPGRMGEVARDKGEPMENLWHQSCNVDYLEQQFKNEVIDN